MRGLRRQRRLLGWLAAIALLGNALAMALVARPGSASTILDGILGPVTLCTASGATVLPDGPGPAEHAPGDHCPACATLAKFALAVAVIVAAFIFPMPAAGRPAPRWQRPSAIRLGLGGICARAPPLLA